MTVRSSTMAFENNGRSPRTSNHQTRNTVISELFCRSALHFHSACLRLEPRLLRPSPLFDHPRAPTTPQFVSRRSTKQCNRPFCIADYNERGGTKPCRVKKSLLAPVPSPSRTSLVSLLGTHLPPIPPPPPRALVNFIISSARRVCTIGLAVPLLMVASPCHEPLAPPP